MTLARLVLAVVLGSAVFAIHARWVLTHFSSDGYLYDSGWLAFLFASADPWLRNPSSINGLSFHAHHLSPHIFLFGAPFALMVGLGGIEILAIHQGVFFALFALAVQLVASPLRAPSLDAAVATMSAVLIGALANGLFQAAGYPHYEIATLACASLALGAWIAGRRRLFLVCLLWLPLIREDGAFYAAAVCLACLVVDLRQDAVDRSSRRLLVMVAGVAVAVGVCAFAIKASFFPGFDAFAFNYSGDGWAHLTASLVAERARAMLANPSVAPVLIGSIVLAVFDWRYVTGLVLLSPVYLLHLASVRPEHGHFTLYYGLPWLVPAMIWLALFVRRAHAASVSHAERLVLLVLSLAIAAPVQAALGVAGQSWYVAKWAVQRPVVNIDQMKTFALWVRTSYSRPIYGHLTGTKHCASMGIAGLIPDNLRPDEVLDPGSDLAPCRTIMLLLGDMDHGPLSTRAAAQGFKLAATRHNAELWLRDPN